MGNIVTLGVEYIVATFNGNIKIAIHVIAIYKPPTLLLSTFIIHLRKFLDFMPTSFLAIIIGDFDIDMLQQTRDNYMYSIALCTIIQ